MGLTNRRQWLRGISIGSFALAAKPPRRVSAIPPQFPNVSSTAHSLPERVRPQPSCFVPSAQEPAQYKIAWPYSHRQCDTPFWLPANQFQPNDATLVNLLFGPLLGALSERETAVIAPSQHLPFQVTYRRNGRPEAVSSSADNLYRCTLVIPELLSIMYYVLPGALLGTMSPGLTIVTSTIVASEELPRNHTLTSVIVEHTSASYRLTCISFPKWETVIHVSFDPAKELLWECQGSPFLS